MGQPGQWKYLEQSSVTGRSLPSVRFGLWLGRIKDYAESHDLTISTAQDTTLANDATVFIIVESNYSGSGVYPTTATVNSSSYSDTTHVMVTN